MNELRWLQRFENFEQAFLLLNEALANNAVVHLSNLEKEGVIQRFQYTFELAWKTLKDYLQYTGILFEQITPRRVIKEAFAARIITDGAIWIKMLEHRNLMSHTYNKAIFENAIDAINRQYLTALTQLFNFLKAKSTGMSS